MRVCKGETGSGKTLLRMNPRFSALKARDTLQVCGTTLTLLAIHLLELAVPAVVT